MHHNIKCMQAPEVAAEGSQDIFMCFETDAFDHQHAVTQQPLNPLLLELLQEVGAVAGQSVHGHSAAIQADTRQDNEQETCSLLL